MPLRPPSARAILRDGRSGAHWSGAPERRSFFEERERERRSFSHKGAGAGAALYFLKRSGSGSGAHFHMKERERERRSKFREERGAPLLAPLKYFYPKMVNLLNKLVLCVYIYINRIKLFTNYC